VQAPAQGRAHGLLVDCMEGALPPADGKSPNPDRQERRDPRNPKPWTGEERRRMLEQVREIELLVETFRSIRRNRPTEREDSDDRLPNQALWSRGALHSL
jgi:hypothetical protein